MWFNIIIVLSLLNFIVPFRMRNVCVRVSVRELILFCNLPKEERNTLLFMSSKQCNPSQRQVHTILLRQKWYQCFWHNRGMQWRKISNFSSAGFFIHTDINQMFVGAFFYILRSKSKFERKYEIKSRKLRKILHRRKLRNKGTQYFQPLNSMFQTCIKEKAKLNCIK